MVDDVPDLVIHELLVERRKHRSLAGRSEKHLEVLCAIPHQGTHAFITSNAERVMQGVGESGGACTDIGEGRLFAFVAGIGAVPRDYLSLAVDGGAVLQDAGEGQRDILHCGEHAHHFSCVSVSAVDGCGIVVRDWRGKPSSHLRAPSTVRTPAVKNSWQSNGARGNERVEIRSQSPS